jgi:hypothetical protein
MVPEGSLNIHWCVIFIPMCVEQGTSVNSNARHDKMIR